jgi:DNA polymerase III epsilon subunit-like protein
MTASSSAPLRLLILDTETNGLPKNRFAPPSMIDAWPAILQLSYAIYTVTDNGRSLHPGEKRDLTIALPATVPWDAGAAKIHGITEEASRSGLPADVALLGLADILRTVDVVVAHNLDFDKPVIRAAAYAASMQMGDIEIASRLRNIWPNTIAEFCTMRATRDLVQIPSPYYTAHPEENKTGRDRFKLPKLNELYTWIYGHAYDISGASLHSSRSDTHCLARCLEGLLRKGHARIEARKICIGPNCSFCPAATRAL